VRQALEARLKEVEWMQPSTREKALAKMSAFGVKIGYPDSWVDYGAVHIVQGDHLGNVLRARAFEHTRQMAFADAPTDRSRWLMLPQQINAYYHPNLNEIVFPAAILQPPFFDAAADDAVNFGSFGAVVGHEMTHGFDDQGRQYDHKGNLSDWWEKADAEEYERRVAVQVAPSWHPNPCPTPGPNPSPNPNPNQVVQAGKVEVHGKPLNGKLTCGENIADLGGLKLAYKALVKAGGKEAAAPINGFTPTQRFFLAWAQLWRRRLKVHPLGCARSVSAHALPRAGRA
jgi:predicted metalloendopeptidase